MNVKLQSPIYLTDVIRINYLWGPLRHTT